MQKYKIKVGIIGGSGLGNIASLILESGTVINPEDAKNDFGMPSGAIHVGRLNGIDVALLSRHGPGHKLNPTQVNYRANIEALKSIGCTHVLSSNACGSLSESIDRGHLVVPDSFIDRTHGRKNTLFDGTSSKYTGVRHVPMEPAFNPATVECLYQAGCDLGLNIKKGGTIVAIEGPRFSSKAESNLFRLWGGDIIGMTTCPEVSIAKEAGLLYASIAMVTDYDCWRETDDKVCVADVLVVFKDNVSKVINLIIKAVELIGKRNWDQDINDLKNLIENSNTSSS